MGARDITSRKNVSRHFSALRDTSGGSYSRSLLSKNAVVANVVRAFPRRCAWMVQFFL